MHDIPSFERHIIAPGDIAAQAALLDLYRATGNQQGFENAANEFALYLDDAWPIWAPLSDTTAALAPAGLLSS